METDLDGWLFVLKNMSRLERVPLYLRKPIFEKLFNIAEYSKLTKEEKDMYDTSLKRKWDNKALLDYAKEEGRQEERAKADHQFVKNLIESTDFDDHKIAELASVSLEFVHKVKSKLLAK